MVLGAISRAWRSRSTPAMTGMRWSLMRACTFSRLRISSASWPLVVTSTRYFAANSRRSERSIRSSSSTNSRVGLGSLRRPAAGRLAGWSCACCMACSSVHDSLDRQADAERRAPARFRLHLDAAAVVLDDAEDDGQPEPRSFADRLGGEERVIDLLQVLRRDALAVVLHHDMHVLLVSQGSDHDPAIAVDGLGRVGHQVEEDLVDLRGRTAHFRQHAEVAHHLRL